MKDSHTPAGLTPAAARTPPTEDPPPSAALPPRRRRLSRLLFGPPQDPRWLRPALLAVVVLAGVLYTWSLDTVGYGNAYYAAAAASGAASWKAWFFGSLDPASFITVDKPPASLWLTGLSVRIFGLSSWSILLPQALAGVATIVVLYRTVRRWMGAPAGLMAAGAMALTPVAVVMYRYNNPDALLVLLAVSALAMGFRAIESGRLRWLLGALGLTGLAFLTKTTQALLVVPALGLAYLVAAPGRLRRRLGHLALGTVVLVAAAGWWIAAVQLTPASDRPYAAGTADNSPLEYALFGYNGVERLTGESDSGPAGGFGGSAGWTRVFNDEVGGQVSWLVPTAALGLAAGLWTTRRGRRTDLRRAGWLLWGTAFLTQMAIFSFISGIFHPYYTLTLAPVLAALGAAGAVVLWRAYCAGGIGALLLPASIGLTAAWAAALLARTPDFAPGLAPAVLGVALAAAGLLLLLRVLRPAGALPVAAAAMGLAVLLTGPAAYSLDTIGQATAGGNPLAGPTAIAGALALPGGAARPAGGNLPDGGAPLGPEGSTIGGGTLAYLTANRGETTWLVATEGSQTASAIILATGEPAMDMGGFTGSDPVPTAAQLAEYVATGRLRFVLLSGGGAGPPGAPQSPSDPQPQAEPPRPSQDGSGYLPAPPGASRPGSPPSVGAPADGATFPGGSADGQIGTSARTTWVMQNCSPVDPAEYGESGGAVSLYDCAP
jgi:4-amino-4-deoxy-L-arabinose transferase-like glycosyltransferase